MPSQFIEPPILAEQVASGALPPIAERLPSMPSRGRHGMGRTDPGPAWRRDAHAHDLHQGYAHHGCLWRCAAGELRPDYQLVPDILQAFEVGGGPHLHLPSAPGQKWSDGSPFTTEDFRYYWEDVANNPELSPAGPPVELLVDGEAPKVEILDETTIRYSWSKPNCRLPAGDRGAEPALYLPPEQVSEEVSREVCRRGTRWRRWSRNPASRTGRRCITARTTCTATTIRAADLGALGAGDQAADRALRLQAQSLLLPGRQRRAVSCPISTP